MADARLLHPGDGEVISDRTARTVILKTDLPALGMSHSRYAAGERGPDPHVHHDHDDSWYVLAGELTFELGAGEGAVTERVGAGGFVLTPPGLVHSFRNEGPDEVLFLNLHVPCAGFGDYMRALRDGRRRAAQEFDQHPPPPDGGRTASDAIVLQPGAGRRVSLGPSGAFAIKCASDDSLGALALMEFEVAAGYPGPLPHRHAEMIDNFWVLDGTLDVLIDDEWAKAGPGDYALIPPGNAHTFANRGEQPVRVLNLFAPGGLERYLLEVAAMLTPGAPPDPAAMAEVAARYDFEAVS